MSGRSGWIPVLALSLLFGAVGMGLHFLGPKFEESERRAADAEARARGAETARAIAEGGHAARARDLESRIEVLRKQVADLESAGRDRERDLLAVRADLERARRAAEEESRRQVEESRRLVEEARLKASAARVMEGGGLRSPDPPKAPAEVPPAPEKPPAPTLGPTAVTDPNQVRKLVDGLNTLLAGVGGEEKWRVLSARATEDDRLVQVVLEARGADGTVSKAFQAGEVRFVLQTAGGTLAIKMKEGSVTYPGNRTVPFPGGAYTVLLVVDPAPFRASGNPLVSIL